MIILRLGKVKYGNETHCFRTIRPRYAIVFTSGFFLPFFLFFFFFFRSSVQRDLSPIDMTVIDQA